MSSSNTTAQSTNRMTSSSSTSTAAAQSLTEDEKRNSAWHYYGYPELARWMASSPSDFFLLRRFSSLTARYLLFLQHQIAKREAELKEIDAKSIEEQPGFSYLDCLDEDSFTRRSDLMEEVGNLLQKYFDLVNSFSEVRFKPTARNHHIQNMENWFETYPDAIRPFEQHFKSQRGDLFPLLPKARSPLATLLHKSSAILSVFQIKKSRSDLVGESSTKYWSNSAFTQVVCAVTVAIGLALMFAPMWWLHFVEDGSRKLGIITAFVTLFAFWLWVSAGPRQFEILLGTAAYAAVLYIYLQASSDPPALDTGTITAQMVSTTEAAARILSTFRA